MIAIVSIVYTPRIRLSYRCCCVTNKSSSKRTPIVGHTAWEPQGREGQSEGGPKGLQLEVLDEVGAQWGPKLLYLYIWATPHHCC